MISKFVWVFLLFSLTANTAGASNDSFRLWDVSEQTEIPLSEAAGEIIGENRGKKLQIGSHFRGNGCGRLLIRRTGIFSGDPTFHFLPIGIFP